jgi:hypothetical protein
MKITVTKIIRELQKDYGWFLIDSKREITLIKDVRTVIDNELLKHKNLTIKK